MLDGLDYCPAYERRRRRRREWFAAGLLTLGGCASTCGDTSDPGAIGELGNGRFLYQCGGSSDPVCEFTDPGAQFPACIVLGGVFDLEYELLDTSALEDALEIDPVLYVESIHQGFFGGTDDFEALRPGDAAFVARESEYALDLIHLRVVAPDDFDISARDPAEPTSAVGLQVGETEVLRIFPRSLECEQLGGAVPVTAESSDESVAAISGGDVLRIQAQGEGTAVVRVQLHDLEKTITVTVGPGAPAPADDSGSDDGVDTDGDGTDADSTDATDTASGGSTSEGM